MICGLCGNNLLVKCFKLVFSSSVCDECALSCRDPKKYKEPKKNNSMLGNEASEIACRKLLCAVIETAIHDFKSRNVSKKMKGYVFLTKTIDSFVKKYFLDINPKFIRSILSKEFMEYEELKKYKEGLS